MPIDPANAAVAPLEASTQIGGSVTPSGRARTDAKGWSGANPGATAREHLLDLLGKQLTVERPERARGCGSVPARAPDPDRRLGCSVSSVWNASATRSGAWFGNMMPPDPTRMRDVADATCSIRISGTELADAGHAVMFGEPVAHEPQPLGETRQVDRFLHRFACRGSIADRNEIEDRKCVMGSSHSDEDESGMKRYRKLSSSNDSRPHLESFDGEKRVERKSSAEHDVDEQAIPRCARRVSCSTRAASR